jgi:hypothetical protein
MVPPYWRAFRRIQMTLCEYFGAFRAPSAAVLPMIVVVLTVQHALVFRSFHRFGLLVEVLAGAATYAGVLWYFHKPRLRALYAIVKSVRTR